MPQKSKIGWLLLTSTNRQPEVLGPFPSNELDDKAGDVFLSESEEPGMFAAILYYRPPGLPEPTKSGVHKLELTVQPGESSLDINSAKLTVKSYTKNKQTRLTKAARKRDEDTYWAVHDSAVQAELEMENGIRDHNGILIDSYQ